MIGGIGKKIAGKIGGAAGAKKQGGGGIKPFLKKLQEKLQNAKSPQEAQQIKERILEKLQQSGKLTPQLQQAIQTMPSPAG